MLGRLAAAEGHQLRLSTLAHEAGLSLSRVSRIIDLLEARKLVTREPCAEDARAVEAHLTNHRLSLARQAQAAHSASVQHRFFDKLEPGELAVLANVFGRLSPRPAATCTTD